MVNVELNKQLRELHRLIDNTKAATAADLELQAHWARYICVRSSGFLENAIEEIFGAFVRGAASQPVVNFATRALGRVQNPKAGRFIEIAESFKPSWKAGLEGFLQDDGRDEAINSIMTNRHKIAHGEDSDITMARVIQYLNKSVKVLEFIEQQCLGNVP